MKTRSKKARRCPHCSWISAMSTAILIAGFAVDRSVVGQTSSPGDPGHFTYDATVPLGMKQLTTRMQSGVAVQDITYLGEHGDIVPAYLVVPQGTGKFAAVIWGHWLMPGAANSSREEFLNEAITLAPRGVISLLIDSPQHRPGFRPAANPVLVTEQVIDLRRGLDLLLSRPDVDASRIAYVGHSWNAGNGAILDAVDKRFAAFVFMSGPQSTIEYMISSDSPRMVAARKTADMAKVEATLKANAWADPASYAKDLGPAAALFQYGLRDDDWVPQADAKDYVAKVSGPKQVQFYDADHSLNEKAREDRDEFLRQTLHLAGGN
jgi:cephalosporin-C deacetylase-like acetyl esterase